MTWRLGHRYGGPHLRPAAGSCVEQTSSVDGSTVAAGSAQDVDRAVAGAGRFVRPTVYADVHHKMRISREGVPGTVLVVIPFATAAQVVGVANDSPYGLKAGVWTRDISRAKTAASQLKAGRACVNACRAGRVQPPFGVFEQSGYRQEEGRDALHPHIRTESVTVALSTDHEEDEAVE